MSSKNRHPRSADASAAKKPAGHPVPALTAPKPTPFWHQPRVWSFILAAVTLLLYWPVRHFEFINYDDPDYITQNFLVRSGFTLEGLKWAFGQLAGEHTYWHPITWMSHMLDCELFGVHAGAHHLVNVGFHSLNALLLFWLLLRMTAPVMGQPFRTESGMGQTHLGFSFLVAALFAWHPLQVDTVAWVTERKNVLSTMFWLLTMHAYVRHAQQKIPNNTIKSHFLPFSTNYLLALFFFALGLMCKPMLVTLPCVLLLLDYWPMRRVSSFKFQVSSGAQGQRGVLGAGWIGLAIEKWPFFVLSVASGVITILGHHQLQAIEASPWAPRVANAVVSYARYILKVLWPSDLSVYYPHPGSWPGWMVFLSAGLVIGLLLVAIVQARRRPYVLVGWLWFLGVLVPTIGLIQAGTQSMADRFAYVPLMGLFIAVAGWLTDGGKRPAWIVRTVTGVALVAMTSCLAATHFQLRHWKDSETLFRHALAVTTANEVAHNSLGMGLADKGRFDEAVEQYELALKIDPNYEEPFNNLGSARARQGRFAEAIQYYKQALRLHPSFVAAYNNLGTALLLQDRIEEAVESYRNALKLNPNIPDAHSNLAVALSRLGRMEESLEHYRKALQINPDYLEAMDNLAWLLATSRDPALRRGTEALEWAHRSLRLTGGKDPAALDTLAAALAELGRFTEAVQVAERALAAAGALGRTEQAGEIQTRLNLYRTSQPFRSP